MPPVVSKTERRIMYAITIIVDVAQFFLVGTIIAGTAADAVIGGVLITYAIKRRLLTPAKALVFAATFVGEAIPFINAAPFWTLDLKNLYSGTLFEKEPENPEGGPVNAEPGIRYPSNQQRPYYENGIGRPRQENQLNLRPESPNKSA